MFNGEAGYQRSFNFNILTIGYKNYLISETTM